LTAYQSDWKKTMHKMRIRIEKERTPVGKDHLAIKTGAGGLMDAEFLAQALCLEQGWHEPNTCAALERARREGVLEGADPLIAGYRSLRRIEGILRRWSYEGETVLPDTPAPYYRVSVRCGFESSEAFSKALAQWRQSIRASYNTIFAPKAAK
jgi:glutamine synthetase adenylyltransferase